MQRMLKKKNYDPMGLRKIRKTLFVNLQKLVK